MQLELIPLSRLSKTNAWINKKTNVGMKDEMKRAIKV